MLDKEEDILATMKDLAANAGLRVYAPEEVFSAARTASGWSACPIHGEFINDYFVCWVNLSDVRQLIQRIEQSIADRVFRELST